MKIIIQRYTKIILFLIIISLLLPTFSIESQSAPKKKTTSVKKETSTKKSSSVKKSKKSKKSKHPMRVYDSEKTRNEAQELIRSNSTQISMLAGLSPNDKETINNKMKEETEIIDEGENLTELEQEDDITIDMDNFKMIWLNFVEFGANDNEYIAGGLKKKDIMNFIMDWLGTPYHFGGKTNRGIDCSAFIQRVFLMTGNIALPRTAREQYEVGMQINRRNLKFGDLIFFHTYSKSFASHVGIYLGDDLFAHSSSRGGVTVSSLESTFYKTRFIGGRRLSANDIARYSLKDSAEDISN